tara:strand:- start:340 stop:477 length:138 start_codon:yes stop_codon:yes gene_type:complete
MDKSVIGKPIEIIAGKLTPSHLRYLLLDLAEDFKSFQDAVPQFEI